MMNHRQGTRLRDVRLGLPTVLMLLALVGAGAFAAGNAMPTAAAPPTALRPSAASAELSTEADPELEQETLPPGHPAVDTMDPMAAVGATPGGAPSLLTWKAPARWQLVPNASSMRLATYRVPHAPGDAVDAELSVTQAGGSTDANAQRWIGQFDSAGQKPAKVTTRRVGSLDVLVVEVQGTFSGGMGQEGRAQPGWALLGAIVSTPGMPHFFKLTGPAKTVSAARGEFDAMLGTLALAAAQGT
jgi:hypothetical protein